MRNVMCSLPANTCAGIAARSVPAFVAFEVVVPGAEPLDAPNAARHVARHGS
jgi:hypothetical protein